jgi:hypothetical protein
MAVGRDRESASRRTASMRGRNMFTRRRRAWGFLIKGPDRIPTIGTRDRRYVNVQHAWHYVSAATDLMRSCDTGRWLGREDSNLRMTESKSVALPLGDAPTGRAGDRSGRAPRKAGTRIRRPSPHPNSTIRAARAPPPRLPPSRPSRTTRSMSRRIRSCAPAGSPACPRSRAGRR